VRDTKELWNMPIVFLLLLLLPSGRNGYCGEGGASFEDGICSAGVSAGNFAAYWKSQKLPAGRGATKSQRGEF